MDEIEKSYLVKELPHDLAKCESKEIFDIYIPCSGTHSRIRIRQNGDKYELTKKTIVDPKDPSHLKEENISLLKEEFDCFAEMPGAKKLRKIRYYYPYDGRMAEIDVFQDDLKGLVLAEFEFDSKDILNSHKLPNFCLVDVTDQDFIAGGVLCGKSYSDIKADLEKFNYVPLK